MEIDADWAAIWLICRNQPDVYAMQHANCSDDKAKTMDEISSEIHNNANL